MIRIDAEKGVTFVETKLKRKCMATFTVKVNSDRVAIYPDSFFNMVNMDVIKATDRATKLLFTRIAVPNKW